jgi:hypothetical protein
MSGSDTEQTMFFSRPEGLARILSLDDEAAGVWDPAEMKAMWLHQLSAPLETDLGGTTSATSEEAASLKLFSGKNFSQLLAHDEPPLALLHLTKEFAKQTLKDADDKQLKEIASALYYAAYAVALTRCGKSLGSLKGYHLVAGFSWAAERAWVDEPTQTLFRTALQQVARKQ